MRRRTSAGGSARRILAPPLGAMLQVACDERGPAGLMAGAEAAAVFAVEIFVEQDEIPPVRVAGESPLAALPLTLTTMPWKVMSPWASGVNVAPPVALATALPLGSVTV